jgi:hypothetical protein
MLAPHVQPADGLLVSLGTTKGAQDQLLNNLPINSTYRISYDIFTNATEDIPGHGWGARRA